MLKRLVYMKDNKTKQELIKNIDELWKNNEDITQDINSSTDNMPSRVKAVLKAKNRNTKYYLSFYNSTFRLIITFILFA